MSVRYELYSSPYCGLSCLTEDPSMGRSTPLTTSASFPVRLISQWSARAWHTGSNVVVGSRDHYIDNEGLHMSIAPSRFATQANYHQRGYLHHPKYTFSAPLPPTVRNQLQIYYATSTISTAVQWKKILSPKSLRTPTSIRLIQATEIPMVRDKGNGLGYEAL
ncbi:uncharacterized protein EI97DRAFT_121914 [Westerdykella ornata]|uniref:Uncharacterized protein n=1 Tax=Westerdykella ornata TaxID=318751 RepID=A0A6A6JX43_WESOR|nr:uncharacterized protein EI97DRAFT_121914 [Westerdykella ornata]KAF2280388.1 hypothetical protein EI97DRAFT_121914 [Westerdykella ornata]